MRALALAVAVLALTAAPAAAAPELVPLGSFTDPVHVASPPNDPRVFVVEQGGLVKIAGGGTFIDLTGPTLAGGERGLLSIAFPPDYAASGLFYVFMTADPSGDIEVHEYRRSAADPNVADPTLIRRLLDFPHGATNHNGGQLQFGPDGALYASIGDNAVPANAQDQSSPFGKLHRIDTATGATSIWSSGLRNPWRFSFDRGTGALLIGDVGGSAYEEINWSGGPNAGQGVNYGWPCNEGPNGAASCGERAALWHENGPFCAIVAGYVVRDPGLPTLNGRFLYGDNCNAKLWSAALGSGGGVETDLTVSGLASFGEDGCGRIYVASRGSDAVYRLQDGAPSACAPPPGDTIKPKLSLSLPSLGRALERRSLRVAVRCDEACRVSVTTRLWRVGSLSTRRRSLAAGGRAVFTIRLDRATVRKLRRTIRRRGQVRVQITIRATDAAGNRRTATKWGSLR
jgi:Glucose / Sorbosone dehydrogenase